MRTAKRAKELEEQAFGEASLGKKLVWGLFDKLNLGERNADYTLVGERAQMNMRDPVYQD